MSQHPNSCRRFEKQSTVITLGPPPWIKSRAKYQACGVQPSEGRCPSPTLSTSRNRGSQRSGVSAEQGWLRTQSPVAPGPASLTTHGEPPADRPAQPRPERAQSRL